MAKASIVGAKTPRAEAKTAGVEKWTDCYGGGRGDLFTPESNRHPAKMAVALCYRIFEHGRKRGYWKPGDVILDPMAGIGTTLVVGMSLGYSVVGVELEEHFVKLAVENLRHAGAKIGGENLKGSFRLVWGDARRLSEILNLSSGMAHAAVTSPPYTSEFREQHPGTKGGAIAHEAQRGGSFRGYSGVVTSPPYGDQVPSEPIAAWVLKVATEQGMPEAVRRYRAEVMDKLPKHGRWSDENIQAHIEAARRIREDGHYSGAISSPPYADQQVSGDSNFLNAAGRGNPAKAHRLDSYSGPDSRLPTSDSRSLQIGNLRDPRNDIDAVLSSPPYTGEYVTKHRSRDKETPRLLAKGIKSKAGRYADGKIPEFDYGTSPGQIGDLPDGGCRGETYLSAMLAVYRELHAVLKPGGVVCLVTKNPVKAGKIRRLDEDTIRLMEAAGFELIERVQALLAEDLGEQMTLDGGSVKIRRERKSFFKRLFERKRPDLKVDYEDVLFFRMI